MSDAFMVAQIVPTAKGTRTRWLTPGVHYLTKPQQAKSIHTLWDCFIAYTVEWCKPHGGDPERAWIAFRAWGEALGWDRDCNTLKRQDGRTVLNHELMRGVTEATARKHMTMGLAAFNHAKAEERIKEVPKFDMPEAAQPRVRWLTREEHASLMDVPKPEHRQLFWLLAFGTGARTAAMLGLEWSRVDMFRRVIDYRVPGVKYRNKRRAVVPINPALYDHLKAAYEKRDPTCPLVINKAGKRITQGAHYHQCKRDLKAIGIVERGVCRHVARHTVVTWMLRGDPARGIAPAPIHLVAQFVGDRVSMIEKNYSHVLATDLMDATAVLH